MSTSNAPLVTPASARRLYEAIKKNPTLDLFKHGPLVMPRDHFYALVAADESLMPHVCDEALEHITRSVRDDCPVSPSEARRVLASMFERQTTLPPKKKGGRPVRINSRARVASSRKRLAPGKVASLVYADGWYIPAEQSWAQAMRFVQWQLNVLADEEPPVVLSLDRVNGVDDSGEPVTFYDLLGTEDIYFADDRLREEIETALEIGDEATLDALRLNLSDRYGVEPTWEALREYFMPPERVGQVRGYESGHRKPTTAVWRVVPGLLRGMHDPNCAATDVVPGHQTPKRMTKREHELASSIYDPTLTDIAGDYRGKPNPAYGRIDPNRIDGATSTDDFWRQVRAQNERRLQEKFMYATKEDVDRLRAEIEARLQPLEDEHDVRMDDGVRRLLEDADSDDRAA